MPFTVSTQRPHKVKVRAQDVKGETLMLTLSGWQARIFLHEYDHLQASHFPLLFVAAVADVEVCAADAEGLSLVQHY